MKIYDCFPFFNELDLLEIRLEELGSLVDYFILVEGAKTFQGNPKPSYYLENLERFSKHSHKIIRIEVPEEEFQNDPWYNESLAWRSVEKGLRQVNASGDDIIIVSALDEIPSIQSLHQAIWEYPKPCCIVNQFYYFYLNTKYWLGSADSTSWNGPYVTTYDQLNKANIYSFISERGNIPKVPGGWHFSFLGDAENAYKKVHSYSHSEMNHFSKEFYAERIANLEDVFARSDVGFHSYEKIYNLPIYVQSNLDKFKKYIKE